MSWPNASANTITTLARQELRELKGGIQSRLEKGKLDDYSEAHLRDAHERIGQALEAAYVRKQ